MIIITIRLPIQWKNRDRDLSRERWKKEVVLNAHDQALPG
jgi:hypothetical protein